MVYFIFKFFIWQNSCAAIEKNFISSKTVARLYKKVFSLAKQLCGCREKFFLWQNSCAAVEKSFFSSKTVTRL